MSQFTEDDVLNFKITEAIVYRVAKERERQNTVKKAQEIVKDHKQHAIDAGLITHGGR